MQNTDLNHCRSSQLHKPCISNLNMTTASLSLVIIHVSIYPLSYIVSNNIQIICVFKWCLAATKWPKVCEKNIYHTITTPVWTAVLRRMLSFIYTKFWHYHPNVAIKVSKKFCNRHLGVAALLGSRHLHRCQMEWLFHWQAGYMLKF